MTIQQLIRRCACGVHLTVNPHRDYYQDAADYLKDMGDCGDGEIAEPNVIKRMIESDTIVHLQFYPHTPIGFYSIYHYDLGLALAKAAAELDNDGPRRTE